MHDNLWRIQTTYLTQAYFKANLSVHFWPAIVDLVASAHTSRCPRIFVLKLVGRGHHNCALIGIQNSKPNVERWICESTELTEPPAGVHLNTWKHLFKSSLQVKATPRASENPLKRAERDTWYTNGYTSVSVGYTPTFLPSVLYIYLYIYVVPDQGREVILISNISENRSICRQHSSLHTDDRKHSPWWHGQVDSSYSSPIKVTV